MSKIEENRKDIVYSTLDVSDDTNTEKVPTIGVRHYQALLYFLMIFIGFGFRVSLSVSIVAMTDPKASINPDIPVYPDWKNKGVILSAFFWGYVLPQVIAGYVANRFGPKMFLIAGMGLQGILAISLPYTAATYGSMGLIVNRALQGFCQGFFIPSTTYFLSQWVPKEERSRISVFCYGAIPSGTIAGIILTGIACESWYGWPIIFYIYGAVGLVWCVIYGIYAHATPLDHPTITKAEQKYIRESLGHASTETPQSVPWCAIITSKPVWAMGLAQSGCVFVFAILFTQIPTYLNKVMNFNIKDNSLLSSLPYLTFWILGQTMGFVSDYVINKKFVSQGVSRKICNSIGLLTPTISLMLLSFTKGSDTTQGVLLLIISVGFLSISNLGWGVNHMDLSPNHAGVLMGLTNCLSNLFSSLAPLSAQFLVKDEKDPVEWRTLFFLTGIVNIVAATFYNIFGSGEVQPWNSSQSKESD